MIWIRALVKNLSLFINCTSKPPTFKKDNNVSVFTAINTAYRKLWFSRIYWVHVQSFYYMKLRFVPAGNIVLIWVYCQDTRLAVVNKKN